MAKITCNDPGAFNTLARTSYAVGMSFREMAESFCYAFDFNDPGARLITSDGTATTWEPADIRPKRLRCRYCGCLSEKDYGTCEHCGAPL